LDVVHASLKLRQPLLSNVYQTWLLMIDNKNVNVKKLKIHIKQLHNLMHAQSKVFYIKLISRLRMLQTQNKLTLARVAKLVLSSCYIYNIHA